MTTQNDTPRTAGFQRIMAWLTQAWAFGGIPTGLVFAVWQKHSGWFLVGLAFSALNVAGYSQVRAVDGRTMLEHAEDRAH